MSSLRTTVIGCGGAGSNIVDFLKNGMNNEDFIEYLSIDSSDANKKEGIPFYHIKTDNTEANNLSGAGGIRGEHFEDIMPGCKKFVNEKGLHKHQGVVILVFSTSGGSGNIIATNILRTLLSYQIPVYCIYVHDGSNLQYAAYGKKVTETIFTASQDFKVALPVSYFVNTLDKQLVNESILKEFRLLMKFHDTDNITEIDNQDMKNFYTSIKYKDSVKEPGVMAVALVDPKYVTEILSKNDVIIARSLTNDDSDPIKAGSVKQNKNGTSKDGTETVALLLNNFDKQYSIVKKAYESYDQSMKKFTIDEDVSATKDGIVF